MLAVKLQTPWEMYEVRGGCWTTTNSDHAIDGVPQQPKPAAPAGWHVYL